MCTKAEIGKVLKFPWWCLVIQYIFSSFEELNLVIFTPGKPLKDMVYPKAL